jgi:hypothetical protein
MKIACHEYTSQRLHLPSLRRVNHKPQAQT